MGSLHGKPVTNVVHQRSILGPVYAGPFLVYVYDLPASINITVQMFDDDTKVYKRISVTVDFHDLLDDLNLLSNWFRIWVLHFI